MSLADDTARCPKFLDGCNLISGKFRSGSYLLFSFRISTLVRIQWPSGEKVILAGLLKNVRTQLMLIIGTGNYTVSIHFRLCRPFVCTNILNVRIYQAFNPIHFCLRTEKNASQWSKDKLRELLEGFEVKNEIGEYTRLIVSCEI